MTDKEIISYIGTPRQNIAFEHLYTYYPSIRKLILKNNGNSQDAEDIFQKTLLVFHKKITDGSFELTSSLSTYLYGVSNYLWKNELRKKGREVTHEEYYHNGYVEETLEQIDLTNKILEVLGEKCRTLLTMFYVEGFSMKEIAEKLSFSSGKSAKAQKYKCLGKAKTRLAELKTVSL